MNMETKKPLKLFDAVKIGSYEEVEGLELSTITKNEGDKQKLNGLILKGYETKFGKTNENGERYTKDCLDKFLDKYFVKNNLNMPVDIQHRDDIQHLAGRVLIVEVNLVGFYFVAYVPKTYMHYESLKSMLQEGILQGFSKCGWATDYNWVYKKNGSLDYFEIREFEMTSLSIVATPANAVNFEKMQEIKDALKVIREEPKKNNSLSKLFHN